jgi:UDP-N-acetylglucosamine 1-carboxyvinyltransferase
MDKLIINGGTPLKGEIRISGAKNAALPLMCASLLSSGNLTLNNLPKLADITTLASVLEHLGVDVEIDNSKPSGQSAHLKGANATVTKAPYDMVRKMRASILVLGPLVARHGMAEVSLPGGCAIGNRPIDLHLKGLEDLGAKIELADGYVIARAPKEGLRGGLIRLPMVSVGATENLIMAATLAKGETRIENAAREPEITDLANCLTAMGAKIEGAGRETILIQGVDDLHSAQYSVMADRIEAGSYAAAAAITSGSVKLKGVKPSIMGATIEVLKEIGIQIFEGEYFLDVSANLADLKGINIRTQPYPGFATDMQAQVMALLTLCNGASIITETIFENRFMHVPELSRMGADITVSGNSATIKGIDEIKGAQVMATDLRASMSLVLAGLAATGETVVNHLYHLDRGYEDLEDKLLGVGANIKRVSERA